MIDRQDSGMHDPAPATHAGESTDHGSSGTGDDDLLFGELQAAYQRNTTHDRAAGLDKYEILREIHRGGQGIVFEAVQRSTNRRVALKLLLHGVFSSERARRRFEREIDLIAGLNHPHIVTLYESGDADGQPFYAMEHIDGVPVSQSRLWTSASAGTRDAIRQFMELFRDICEAAAYYQRHGLIHRDLKPDNILIDSDDRPHIVDFGLARENVAAASPVQTRSGEFLGTLAYASPEQAAATTDAIDIRTDVYSLGVMLYEALTGQLPYAVTESLPETIDRICHSSPATTPLAGLDTDLQTIILKALAKEPERRYDSAASFSRDIVRYLGGEAIEARADSTWYVLSKAMSRYRVAVCTAAAFLLVLIGSGIAMFVLWRQAADDRDAALQARARADEARAEERRQRREAQYQAYVAGLPAGLAAIADFRVLDAMDYLQRADETLRNWEWYYVLSRIDTSITTWKDHSAGVETMDFNPDGSLLATGDLTGVVHVRRLDTQAPLASASAGTPIHAVAFLPSGTVAVAGDDGLIRELDPISGEWVAEWRALECPVKGLAVDIVNSRLAACGGTYGSKPGHLAVFELASRKQVLHRTIDESEYRTVIFLDGGQQLLTADDKLRLIDIASGSTVRTYKGHTHWVNALASINDDRTFLSASDDGTIRFWNVETGLCEHILSGHRDRVTDLALDPRGERFATCSTDGAVRTWSLTQRRLDRVQWGQINWTSAIAYDSTGETILSIGLRGELKQFRSDVNVQDLTVAAHSTIIHDVVATSDGSRLYSACYDASIAAWDVETATRTEAFQRHRGGVNDLAISADDRWLASASDDNSVVVHNLTSDGWRRFRGHTDHVTCVDFDSDAEHLASGSRDGTVRLWRRRSRKNLKTVSRPEPPRWLRFLDDERLLVVSAKSMAVLDATSLETREQWPIQVSDYVAPVALHPDGVHLAVGTGQNYVTLWNVDDGERIADLKWHAMPVCALAFNESGDRLFAASLDGVVKVWNVARREEVFSLEPQQSYLCALVLLRDQLRLVGGAWDGRLVFWEAVAPRERLLREAAVIEPHP